MLAAEALEGLAASAALRGDALRAARAAGAAAALREAIAIPIPPDWAEVHERLVAEARALAGEAAYDAAVAAGREQSLEEAVEDAVG
jgi:hypothetical protein